MHKLIAEAQKQVVDDKFRTKISTMFQIVLGQIIRCKFTTSFIMNTSHNSRKTSSVPLAIDWLEFWTMQS